MNTSEEPYVGNLLIIKPYEARKIAEKYNIKPLEITRLAQIKNFDTINNTNNLHKTYMQTVRQVTKAKASESGESLLSYWQKRKTFMKEFFFLTEHREIIY